MESAFVKLIVENGIGVGMAVGILVIAYKMTMHILKQQDRILVMATEQNTTWQRQLESHTSQAKAFHDQVTDAHKYQRDEHVKMMQVLENILEKSKKQLEGAERVESLINGSEVVQQLTIKSLSELKKVIEQCNYNKREVGV